MPIPKALSPTTLTILCTYQCTAACKQCCFESSPFIKGRLDKETIIARIAEAKLSFSGLKVVVFSGGEAMLLREDLFEAIAYCSSLELVTRVVSNGYWGKSVRMAMETARSLKQAGLCELNISTGKDHQEWVPIESVINASTAVSDLGIFCLITVENEGPNRQLIDQILKHPLIAPRLQSGSITVQSNSWMPFQDTAEDRKQAVAPEDLRNGCKQIFGTAVITPHDNLSACCGLTLEHIPEMRLGKNNGTNMERLYSSQADDFLKIWIHVDGPYSIIERLMNDKATSYLKGVVHICEACSLMHKSNEIRKALADQYKQFIPEVMTRFQVSMALRDRGTTNAHHLIHATATEAREP